MKLLSFLVGLLQLFLNKKSHPAYKNRMAEGDDCF